jgi:hypothetical protein
MDAEQAKKSASLRRRLHPALLSIEHLLFLINCLALTGVAIGARTA